eukprot:285475-Chlamydomonas_euryale.AAC.1
MSSVPYPWCCDLPASRVPTDTALPYTCSSRTTDVRPRSAGWRCAASSGPATLRRRSRPMRMSCTQARVVAGRQGGQEAGGLRGGEGTRRARARARARVCVCARVRVR